MRVLGFNFTKISADKSPDFKPGPININIEFIDVKQDKVEILRDLEILNIYFRFTVDYSELSAESEKKSDKRDKDEKKANFGQVLFEGAVLLSKGLWRMFFSKAMTCSKII